MVQGEGPPGEQLVVATPEIRHEVLDDTSSFLILACDGIWDILTNEQAVQFVEQQALLGKTPKEICEALCDRCLAPTTQGIGKGCDNMSAIVVFLEKKYAELAGGAMAQSATAAHAAAADAATPNPVLPGGFTPPDEGVGSSAAGAVVGTGAGARSHLLFGSAGQQLAASAVPKRFAVRRSQVPSSSLRSQSTASMHSCLMSAIV